MSLADSGVSHFDSLASATTQLRAHGLTVFCHRFDLLSFGSFLLEVGHPKRRLRFVWDGKDSQLEVSASDFPSQGSAPSWVSREILEIPLAATFESILNRCLQEFDARP